jgi:hypothetical protein
MISRYDTDSDLAEGFRPCGGLSRNDRVPAKLTRSQDTRPRRGLGADPARPTQSRACLATPQS